MSGRYSHLFVLMQRLQDALTDGYTQYLPVQFEAGRETQFRRKFSKAYETEISSQSRWRRRRSELACAKFLTLDDGSGTATAFLLATPDGKGRIRDEPLLDASSKRMTIGVYELVHDGVGWSWRFTATGMKEWRARFHSAIATNDTAAFQQLVRYLYRTAGFRLVRRQVGQLARYIRSEWHRLRRTAPPELPTFLRYIKRLPDNWTPGA